MEATLILDTRRHERELGARSLGLLDRRLLYRTPAALVELRVPPCHGSREEQWVFGQYLPADAAAEVGRLRVVLRDDAGETREVEASETGDFALPCDPSRAFSLECAGPGGPLVSVRFEP